MSGHILIRDIEDIDYWAPLPGHPGYIVSPYGDIAGPGRNGKGKLLKPQQGNKYGHQSVKIKTPEGKKKHVYIHRAVMDAYMPCNDPDKEVMHLDNDPENNNINNLKWGAHTENMRHSIRSGTFRHFTKDDIRKANEKRSTPVTSINLQTGERKTYPSQQEAEIQTGFNQSSISSVVKKKRKSLGHYYFTNDPNEQIDISNYRYSPKNASIKAINIETGESIIFESPTDAANYLGVGASSISQNLSGKIKNTKGYKLQYA